MSDYIKERKEKWDARFDLIHEIAMEQGTAVIPFFHEEYITEFYDFYRVRNRNGTLTSVKEGFVLGLEEVCGVPYGDVIAEKAEELFGKPGRLTVFEDMKPLKEELEGPRGLGPFFFVFDILFAEYDGFTLCFISGSND